MRREFAWSVVFVGIGILASVLFAELLVFPALNGTKLCAARGGVAVKGWQGGWVCVQPLPEKP